MRERNREIRRRRQRREKRIKARIKALIAQSKSIPQKRTTEITEEAKEEKKIIHRKPAAKVIKPAKKVENK